MKIFDFPDGADRELVVVVGLLRAKASAAGSEAATEFGDSNYRVRRSALDVLAVGLA